MPHNSAERRTFILSRVNFLFLLDIYISGLYVTEYFCHP
ncbi:hypothetical protein HMPREF0581_0068 [Mogibacterium timidum ATCC 33093]|uniref:Uncharacterized protein n=1 Tax=Mogibacterium timidum ATCC 33093 TaxID=1401079 RepID=X8IRH7_9FIRM|nr:hypothetical protein HMPREF0581_0068 [Mogibacterium timidum ATCC 33093]